MKSQYVAIHLLLFLTKTLYAKEQQEIEYFSTPSPNQSYKSGDVIQFSAEDVPDEGITTDANLYCDGSLVQTIQSWSATELDDFGEMFDFSWVADGQSCGSCYVEMIADNDKEEVTRSYSFNLECDGTSSSDDGDDQQQQNTPPSLPYYDEEELEGSEEEEGQHGTSIHQKATNNNNHEELTNENQEEPEEIDEPNETGGKKKLSLHNDQTKVAHISSHNDIDTVSDEPNTMMTHRPPTSSANVKQHAAIVHQQENNNKPSSHGLLSNAVEKVQQLTGHKQPQQKGNPKGDHPPKEKAQEDEVVDIPDDKLKVLTPAEIGPGVDMKTLKNADNEAIEQEKLWIKQANGKNLPTKNSSGPKKLILEGLLSNDKKPKHATTHKSSKTTTSTTTTTSHKTIPNIGHVHQPEQPPLQQQKPPMMNPPSSSSPTTSSPQQQVPSPQLSHEGKKIVEEHDEAVQEKQKELQKEIEEAKQNAKEHPEESRKKIAEAQAEAQEDIQKLKLQEQERLVKQEEKEKSSNSSSSPSQYHSKKIKEAAQKNHTSHQKREAFRRVYHNRAKFAKAILQ